MEALVRIGLLHPLISGIADLLGNLTVNPLGSQVRENISHSLLNITGTAHWGGVYWHDHIPYREKALAYHLCKQEIALCVFRSDGLSKS